ncbi:MAG: cadmium-translocating P-type ATPase [Anaerovibrio sp.]|uniref:heavy metal translocating P-type ATPase n=1 Tax=Anaerovibrio sp. TaxID=1872532 RepID=UPI0025E4FA01|nr:heavy metal translocating P-type ATPase [Anaerovibrio sp.]MCR5175217.1 cadmium-translocating P-type ATPase [Anaerovibrio sp.]
MTIKQKNTLKRIIAGIVILAASIFLGETTIYGIGLAVLSFAVVGWDVLLKAVRNIGKGQVFDEFFLMSVASIGAMLIHEYAEGAAVMAFYQLGEWFQSYATGRVRNSIGELIDIRPDYANVVRNEQVIQVDPYEVEVGEVLLVRPGERIPLDGEVIDGKSFVDTAALTGESVPRELGIGDTAISGCINQTASIRLKATATYDQSTVERVLELVETSGTQKAKTEKFITRFARYYTPIVVGIAILVAALPPLLLGEAFDVWLYRALTFLVISCPCALVISIPMSFFGGIGGASRKGILVKGGDYLERLADVEIVAFDKTGTITEGCFDVQEVVPVGSISKEELLFYGAAAEIDSLHPIAESLQRAYGKSINRESVDDIREEAGYGVLATVRGHRIAAGNEPLLTKMNISHELASVTGTVVYIAVDDIYAGYILIADRIKAGAANAIKTIKNAGIRKTVMLSGDKTDIANKVAAVVGMDEVMAELLPADKVGGVNRLLKDVSPGKTLAYVGDGINDAPVLARADIGVAMGGIGSDAAIEAADVVLMTDELNKLGTAIQIARKTMGICWQNIIGSIGIKVLVMITGVLGYTSLWAAVFADVGVAVLAILNAMRALYLRENTSAANMDEKTVMAETLCD